MQKHFEKWDASSKELGAKGHIKGGFCQALKMAPHWAK